MHARTEIRIARQVSRLALACTTLLLLGACEQTGKNATQPGMSELAWARVALERNPNVEVVATDMQAGVFTIRDKRTGHVQAVKLSELAAAPVSQFTAQISRPTAQADVAEPANEEPPAESSGPENAPPPPPARAAAPSPGQSVASAPVVADGKSYTVERADGQVKVSGPGVSIVTSGGTATDSPGGDPGLRKADPIICEGARMIHLDNRKIYVDGDGLTARAGCELYLTNSRIVASGIGVVVQDATVHITNSYIEGASGSFEAGMGAKVFVRDSTFSGLSRRDTFAQVQDQGGNEWR
ncbi:MAG TPA: hypothetical protein VEZ88_13010 [Steroidobacteraceae bacterium]|nr:hypothetical protein [Steroidobacteraceae bacterium]